MKRFVARRLVLVPLILVGMTVLTFAVTRFVPTDPVVAFLGSRGSTNQEAYDNYRAKYGLDRSIPEQYFRYVAALMQGDFGESTSSHRPVIDEIAQFFPATLELTIVSLLIALLLGIPIGVFAAAARGSPAEQVVKAFTMIGISSPTFVVALISLQVFYLALGVVAGSGKLDLLIATPPKVTGMVSVDALLVGDITAFLSVLHHMALPAGVLGVLGAAYFARVVRATMIEALEGEFIRTARGKGLASRIILFRHAFRYALIPTLSLAGLYFGELFAGAITVETITGWPGVGRYMYNAAVKLDFPAVMGGTLVIGVTYIITNLVVDVLYARVDPRVRLS